MIFTTTTIMTTMTTTTMETMALTSDNDESEKEMNTNFAVVACSRGNTVDGDTYRNRLTADSRAKRLGTTCE